METPRIDEIMDMSETPPPNASRRSYPTLEQVQASQRQARDDEATARKVLTAAMVCRGLDDHRTLVEIAREKGLMPDPSAEGGATDTAVSTTDQVHNLTANVVQPPQDMKPPYFGA